MEKYGYHFSFGPWNIHEGADPFVPPVRPTRDFEDKLTVYKAIRTQPASIATKHLRNSMQTFLRLVEVVRALDQQEVNSLIAQRDYEELDWLILNCLMGR